MESYSSTSNTDSSSSNSSIWFQYHSQQELEITDPPPLRRKSPAKKAIAPPPPNPPKIYKVPPVEFKDVVQKLTGAPEFQRTRLQEVAPPALSLSPPNLQPKLVRNPIVKPLLDNFAGKFKAEEEEEEEKRTFGALSPLGFSLSPSSLAWCSTMLLSPGTLASFHPSVLL